MGLEYKYFFRNECKPLASLSLHEVCSFTSPAGFVLPLDKPNAYALYYVEEGRGVYTLSGTEFTARKGDLFAMYPGVGVHCKADKKEPWELYALSFDGADARLLLNAAGFTPKCPIRKLDDYSASNIGRLYEGLYIFRDQNLFGTIQSTALLYTIMSMLVKTASWDQTAMPPGWTGAVHFQKALHFINDNYSRPITVDDIADHVGLSRSRLYRIFMQQVFMPPLQYLNEHRMQEGRRLLERRKGSVKEIAQMVGIDDPLYFSRLFKQYAGKSPTEYIKFLIDNKK
jgi:AraC-like DNA-binding protein